jgi:hypothetical protein
MSSTAYKRISDEELVAKINKYLDTFPNISRTKLLANIGSSYDRIVGLEKQGLVKLPSTRAHNKAWLSGFQIIGKEYGRRNR